MDVGLADWVAVDDTNFDAAVLKPSFERPVVLVLGATWCAHCGPLAEDLDAVLDHLGDGIERAKLWIDRPGLVRGGLSDEQRQKSTVHRSFDRLGSPTGVPRTFVVHRGQVIEGFGGRPFDDAFLVRLSTWLKGLAAASGPTRVVALVRARIRRQPWYRARMGLGIALPTLEPR